MPGPAARWGEVTFQAIAPGIWLHSEYADPPGVGPTRSNGLIVEAGDHSILVDTAWNDAQTGSIVEWAEASLHRPVAAAIVTHAHHDKMGGIAALRSAGIRTFANRLTNADAPKRGEEKPESSMTCVHPSPAVLTATPES